MQALTAARQAKEDRLSEALRREIDAAGITVEGLIELIDIAERLPSVPLQEKLAELECPPRNLRVFETADPAVLMVLEKAEAERSEYAIERDEGLVADLKLFLPGRRCRLRPAGIGGRRNGPNLPLDAPNTPLSPAGGEGRVKGADVSVRGAAFGSTGRDFDMSMVRELFDDAIALRKDGLSANRIVLALTDRWEAEELGAGGTVKCTRSPSGVIELLFPGGEKITWNREAWQYFPA